MITLYIMCILYTFFGLRRFKKLYGEYNIFNQNVMIWTFLLVIAVAFSFGMTIGLIVKYLP